MLEKLKKENRFPARNYPPQKTKQNKKENKLLSISKA